MAPLLRVCVLIGLAAGCAYGLDNGLGLRPQMGWNSWYNDECSSSMTEASIRATVDSFKAHGLDRLGYQYVNLDDCMVDPKRTADGKLQSDQKSFPSGMRALSDYVHRAGLKFGVYSDRGSQTCAGRPAAQGNEELDAKTYADDWQIDYLKEDSCHAPSDKATAFKQYGAMRDALNKTGRPIFFSLCGWNDWYAPEGPLLGNSWRTGPDDTNWPGVLKNVDIMADSGLGDLAQFAGPSKGWNDPCLLLSANSRGQRALTETQTRTQFSLWAVLAAPLLISGNIQNISATDLATYSNPRVIAVSQDPLGMQGRRITGGPLTPGGLALYARPLSKNNSVAVVVVNSGTEAADLECDSKCFAALGWKSFHQLPVHGLDLWSNQATPDLTELNLRFANISANGGSRTFVFTPSDRLADAVDSSTGIQQVI